MIIYILYSTQKGDYANQIIDLHVVLQAKLQLFVACHLKDPQITYTCIYLLASEYACIT